MWKFIWRSDTKIELFSTSAIKISLFSNFRGKSQLEKLDVPGNHVSSLCSIDLNVSYISVFFFLFSACNM